MRPRRRLRSNRKYQAVWEKRHFKWEREMSILGMIGKAAIGLAATAFLTSQVAQAEPLKYPVKVVTLVTHSSPGGGSDVFLREMTKHLGKYIDATFVVEN